MRPIKFRAWNKDTHTMIEWDELRRSMSVALTQQELGHWILMQFTGLFDKNGKEIYEGDVIKVRERIFQVGWYPQSAAFWLFTVSSFSENNHLGSAGVPVRDWNWMNGGSAINFQKEEYDGRPNEVEIIGNIYENPELLEKAAA